MSTAVEAIYEGGILRPLGPLPFAEHERIRISVESILEAPSGVPHHFASADLAGSYALEELPATNARVRENLRQRHKNSL